MSAARRHREKILAALSVATAPDNGAGTVTPAVVSPTAGAASPQVSHTPAGRAAASIGLRLTHDLRDLKNIKSVDHKIAAKRDRIGEYRSWIEGLLEADAGVGTGIAAEIAPTIMVWHIDIGGYADALPIAAFLINHHVTMPARYQRDAASVLAEEMADAAIKAQTADQPFSLDILQQVADLVDGIDMHDQIRAKLHKALGCEQLRTGEDLAADESRVCLLAAQAQLLEAHRLNDRIGVKDRLKRVAKLLAVTPSDEDAGNAPPPPETSTAPKPAKAKPAAKAKAAPVKAKPARRAPAAKKLSAPEAPASDA